MTLPELILVSIYAVLLLSYFFEWLDKKVNKP
jgi:hypothetical protein